MPGPRYRGITTKWTRFTRSLVSELRSVCWVYGIPNYAHINLFPTNIVYITVDSTPLHFYQMCGACWANTVVPTALIFPRKKSGTLLIEPCGEFRKKRRFVRRRGRMSSDLRFLSTWLLFYTHIRPLMSYENLTTSHACENTPPPPLRHASCRLGDEC